MGPSESNVLLGASCWARAQKRRGTDGMRGAQWRRKRGGRPSAARQQWLVEVQGRGARARRQLTISALCCDGHTERTPQSSIQDAAPPPPSAAGAGAPAQAQSSARESSQHLPTSLWGGGACCQNAEACGPGRPRRGAAGGGQRRNGAPPRSRAPAGVQGAIPRAAVSRSRSSSSEPHPPRCTQSGQPSNPPGRPLEEQEVRCGTLAGCPPPLGFAAPSRRRRDRTLHLSACHPALSAAGRLPVCV